MADFLSLLTSGSSPNPITAGFRAYDVQVGRKQQQSGVRGFQYFPERITDSRSPNYSQKEIPGGSHPLYQFVSGGERVIAFDAIFTNDNSGTGDNGGGLAGALVGGVLGFLGGSSNDNNDKIDSDSRKDVVDIAAVIDDLREFTYPTYEQSVSVPPKLIEFFLPSSGIVSHDGNVNSIVGILTRCDVTYEAFHRSGLPRIVVVGLEIREVVQTQTKWQFANWMSNENVTGRSYNKSFIDMQ